MHYNYYMSSSSSLVTSELLDSLEGILNDSYTEYESLLSGTKEIVSDVSYLALDNKLVPGTYVAYDINHNPIAYVWKESNGSIQVEVLTLPHILAKRVN